MKNRLPVILISVFIIGCSQNLWSPNGSLRPKKPKFSILKTQFLSNPLIDTNYIYISTKRPVNYDGNKIVATYGFYSDGRLIVNGFYENDIDSLIHHKISWDSSYRIGYYTTEKNKIKCQYFEQYGGGEYITMEGEIRADSIIFAETFIMLPWRREIRYDTVIKSSYRNGN